MKRGFGILLVLELVTVTLSGSSPIYLGYQDSLGQYTFGYSGPESARSEIRSADGLTTGSFSYVDGAGVIQSARYEADNEGFRIAATNLPQAPQPVADTPEVIAARNEHLKVLALAEQQAQEEAENDKIRGNVNDNGGEGFAEIQSRNFPLDMNKMMVEGKMEDKIIAPGDSALMSEEARRKEEMMREEEMRQELLARNAQVINFSQFARAGNLNDRTPAHTTLIKPAPNDQKPGKAPAKISNRIAPKDGNRTKNKVKISNRIAPKGMAEEKISHPESTFAAVRDKELQGAPIYATYNVIPVGYPYTYNFGYVPYHYEPYIIIH